MAQIGRYVADRSMQSAGPVQTQVDQSLGIAVQRLGNTGMGIAAELQDRQERRENFQNNAKFDIFKINQSKALDEATSQMPEGGTDFTKNYMDSTFGPAKDEFLASLPEGSRERFGALLEVESARFGGYAAEREHKAVRAYQASTVDVTQQEYANAINMDPAKYNELLAKGNDQIEQMTAVSPAEKAELKLKWTGMAQKAHLDRMLVDKPGEVLRMLGADSANWSSGTKFSMLSAAVEGVESGGESNPDTAVSSAGALGRMQVMPGTAAEIAEELGDKNFPQSGNDDQIKSYLANPTINKIYGNHYLQKQLRTFNGDIEAAAVAYNAGPSVAQKWLESGKNDDVLPAETVSYKAKIMDQLKPAVAKIPASDVKLVWARTGGVPLDSDLSKVNPILQDRVKQAFAVMGIGQVRINSGHRDEATNKRVGGAQGSQHLGGNALDIDVKNMPIEERKQLIRALSASGVTGIGIYANAIHVDVGARRAWGADYHGQSVPKWASGVVAEHMSGNAIPPANKGVAPQYSSIDYATRQSYIAQADKLVSSTGNANSPQLQVARQQTRQSMMNDLASYRATGEGSEGFNEEDIATYLGADDYDKYVSTRELNKKIHGAVEGIGTLPQDQLLNKAEEYEPVAGSITFAQDQELQKAVVAEVNRVSNLRAKDPARAAEEIPEVKAIKERALTPDQNGRVDPQAVQDYVRAVLAVQERFNLPGNVQNPDGTMTVHRAPVSKDMAVDIGRRFSNIPPVTRENAQAVSDQIQQNYALVKSVFGDYADEVILYGMSEYHGIDKVLATRITSMMLQLQNGRDPFARHEAPAPENQEGWFSKMMEWLPGGDDGEGTSEEEQRRIAREKSVDE